MDRIKLLELFGGIGAPRTDSSVPLNKNLGKVIEENADNEN